MPADGMLPRPDEIGIKATSPEQFIVRPALNDTPLRHNKNLRGMSNGFQAMRNHDDGFIPRQRFDRLLQSILVLWIDVGRRLVKNDDGRIFKNGAGDGDALFFSARKGFAPPRRPPFRSPSATA